MCYTYVGDALDLLLVSIIFELLLIVIQNRAVAGARDSGIAGFAPSPARIAPIPALNCADR